MKKMFFLAIALMGCTAMSYAERNSDVTALNTEAMSLFVKTLEANAEQAALSITSLSYAGEVSRIEGGICTIQLYEYDADGSIAHSWTETYWTFSEYGCDLKLKERVDELNENGHGPLA